MSERTGLPRTEIDVLRAVDRAGSGMSTTGVVLAGLERDGLVGPRAARQLLVDLIAPWRRHLPLVVGGGNWGSVQGDPPADPEYTEVGLTAYGKLALAAEDGVVGPVPFGHVDGSWYRGGPQPPYRPQAVLDALGSDTIVDLLPHPPSGGTVAGDFAALAAGRPVRLTVSATLVFETVPRRTVELPSPPPGVEGGWFRYAASPHDAGGDRVVITEIPYGLSVDEVTRELDGRARSARHDGPPRHYATGVAQPVRPPAPVVEVADQSDHRDGIRVVARLRDGADVEEAKAWVLSTPSLRIVVDASLSEPLAQSVDRWRGADRSGLHALAGLLP